MQTAGLDKKDSLVFGRRQNQAQKRSWHFVRFYHHILCYHCPHFIVHWFLDDSKNIYTLELKHGIYLRIAIWSCVYNHFLSNRMIFECKHHQSKMRKMKVMTTRNTVVGSRLFSALLFVVNVQYTSLVSRAAKSNNSLLRPKRYFIPRLSPFSY